MLDESSLGQDPVSERYSFYDWYEFRPNCQKNNVLSYFLSRPKTGELINKSLKTFIEYLLVEIKTVLNINELVKMEIIDV